MSDNTGTKNTSKKSTNRNNNNNRNEGNAISTLYIILAFSFAFVAFIVGREPLTNKFPILENFYNIFPSFIVDLPKYLSLTSSSNQNTNDNETIAADPNDLSSIQPLTTRVIEIDPNVMYTSYFSDDSIIQECDSNNWLMKTEPFLGYHLLCVQNKTGDEIGINIEYHRNGIYNEKTSKSYISDLKSFKKLRKELEKVLKITRTDSTRRNIVHPKDRWLKWAMFDTLGRKITHENFRQLFYGTILVFEVGLFQYPPIEIGFERSVLVRNMNPESVNYQPYVPMKLETLSIYPNVISVTGFIASEYCGHIVSDSEKYMKKSTVSHMHNTDGNPDQWRTSETHWLNNKDPIVRIIDYQTSSLVHIPVNYQEHVQVLKYQEGQQYDSHWDYFEPKLYKGTNMEDKIRGGTNRFLTLFWYMTNVTDGGWTYFPRAGNLPKPKHFKLKKMEDCNVGLKVSPTKGSAIIFYSMKPNGDLDELSLHGACPVGHDQIKWGANKWVWTRPRTNY